MSVARSLSWYRSRSAGLAVTCSTGWPRQAGGSRAVDARYLEGTGRLEKALADADVLGNATAEEVATRDVELTLRLGSIDRVLALLGTDVQPASQGRHTGSAGQ